MSRKQPLNLLELPYEILTQIILPLLSTLPNTNIPLVLPDSIEGGKEGSTLELGSVFHDATQIVPVLLIHPIIYSLSIPILYGPLRVFELHLKGGKHAKARSMFTQAFASSFNDQELPLHQHNIFENWLFLRNITSIRVLLDRLRGWTSKLIIPLLQKMILSGSLTHVHIHVDTNSFASTEDAELFAKLAKGAPLRAFVDFLGDPDLKQARLSVSGFHPWALCEYHLGEDRKGREELRSRVSEMNYADVEIEWWRLGVEADKRERLKHIAEV